MSVDALAVSGALHCNLNVVDLAGSAAVYEALGLSVKMKSPAVGQDGTALGIPGPTDSEAWFLYDHRGGRGAPAVELVQWQDPATDGAAYAGPDEVGMWAVGFDVPDAPGAARSVLNAGGLACTDLPSGVDIAVSDRDGVAIELTTAPVEAATFRYVRMNCVDLDASSDFYSKLGFELSDPSTTTWRGSRGDEPIRGCTASLAGAVPIELRLGQRGTPSTSRAHSAANHRGLFRMAFAVGDVAAAIDTARALKITVSDAVYIPLPGTKLGGLSCAFLLDPDGVMVEFVERPLG